MQSIFGMGRLQSYGKMLEAKSLWQTRKQSGYYDKLREANPERASFQEQADQMNSQKSSTEVDGIRNKLRMGQKLTAYEKDLLRVSDPELHKKAEEIEAEQAAFEEKLKRCKTKDEVQRIKMTKLDAAITTVNSVSNNPVIPDSVKLAIAEQENMKLRAVNEAEARFVRSGAYDALPTDNELRLERQEEKAQEAEKPQDTPQEEPAEEKKPVEGEEAVPQPEKGREGASSEITEKKPQAAPPVLGEKKAPATGEAHVKRVVSSYRNAVKHTEVRAPAEKSNLDFSRVDLTRLIKRKKR